MRGIKISDGKEERMGDTQDKLVIALVGQTRAGKTTWIAGLFAKSVREELRSISRENEEGQTKIPIAYELRDPASTERLSVKEVLLNKERENTEDIEDFLKEAGIPWSGNDSELTGFLDSDDFKARISGLDAPDFIRKFLNREKWLEVIRQVRIAGPADDKVWQMMQDRKLAYVEIRDTRGLADESFKKLQEYEKEVNQLKEKEVQIPDAERERELGRKLLGERGITGAEVCVFFTHGNSILMNHTYRKYYGFMLRELLQMMPTILVGRSDRLTELIEEDNMHCEYGQLIQCDERNYFTDRRLKYESCLDDMKKLLDSYGVFSQKDEGHGADYKEIIAKEHYRQMLLANVSTQFQEQPDMKEKYDEIYLYTVRGVFGQILDAAGEYRTRLREAKDLLVQFIDEASQILGEKYLQYFNDNIYDADGTIDNRLFRTLWVQDIVKQMKCDRFRGGKEGMVGPRGGITTWIDGYGRVGKYAIEIMETAYQMLQAIIEQLVTDRRITEKLSERCSDSPEKTEEARAKLKVFLDNVLATYQKCMFCTRLMFYRIDLLEAVWKEMKDLRVSGSDRIWNLSVPDPEKSLQGQAIWNDNSGDMLDAYRIVGELLNEYLETLKKVKVDL